MRAANLFVLLLLLVQHAFAKVSIALDNPNISYDGVFYPVKTPTKVELNRHLTSMVSNWESGIGGTWINQWVITQTGVRIRFKTASPAIDMAFTQRATGGTIGATPNSGFSVFVNGTAIATYSSLSFTVNNPTPGSETTFEVSLPNLWAVDFTGMQLTDGYNLSDPGQLNRPVYVAIGNSITHGTGQYVSSAKTYPFILANKMGWDLHNIAVAGATLGWAVALNTKGKHVDYITVKIGFNDWKYSTGSLGSKKTEYGRLLDSLRAYHPEAKIYCISPIYSSDNSGAAPYALEDFRTMVENLVIARQATDHLLCLIVGSDISDASMLASGDPTHLSEYGANAFANNLYTKINACGSASVQEEVSENSILKINALEKTHLQLMVPYSGKYYVSIYSAEGKLVYFKQAQMSSSGINNMSLSGNEISGGFYIVQVVGEKSDSSSVKVFFE
ncbi:MAG: SGNH/GDSL hydrolase family protein [Bacteroidetes bacterium]|nr:SGNH/GDSL hydrolase family protein [Bacteroidota bacterium]